MKRIVLGSRTPVRYHEIDTATGKITPDNALEGVNIATVHEDTEKFEEWTANARLIAAAPELLEALVELMSIDFEYDITSAVYDGNALKSFLEARKLARAAIAKAEG